MIRRLTALLAMIALLGLLAVLILEVQQHHNRGFRTRHDTAIVENFSLYPALAS